MADDDPAPIPIMAMTDPTPMKMPSIVSAARKGLRNSARKDVRRMLTALPLVLPTVSVKDSPVPAANRRARR